LGFATAFLLGLLRSSGFKWSTSGFELRLARRETRFTLATRLREFCFSVRFRLRLAFKAAFCLFVPKCAICFGVSFRFRRFRCGLLASRVVLTTLI
jgi:hypothetical protein